jgi:hypothetical protein
MGDSVISLLGYLLYSGIGGDLVKVFARPGSITDISIMRNVQTGLKDARRAEVTTEEVKNFPLEDAMW